MEKPRLEVVVVSSERPVCPRRRVLAPEEDLEEDQPVVKRPRTASPVCHMEWETSLQPPHKGPVAPSLACPPSRPRAPQPQRKKKPRRAAYDPNDFTSDEMDPAFEWPRESPLARKLPSRVPDGAEIALLQSILGQFPLGLRLEKLVTLMWKEHKVHLWKRSIDRGYRDILQFLEEVPRVRLSLSKGGSCYLVHVV